MRKFPQGFLWGAATSAYQVEGGNFNSDWHQWEKEAKKENCGAACSHYNLYEQDFGLAKSLNHNSHRLSIEWSRIEPQEGRFSQKELGHYVDVVRSLKARNIEPLVTLHHFTNPLWFLKSGGWENRRSVFWFLRYCDFVVRGLAKDVHYWITINEPTIYISHAYILGLWPPQAKSLLRAKMVQDNILLAHIKAYQNIHAIYKECSKPKPAVSISQYTQAYVACMPSVRNRLAAYLRDSWYNFGLLRRIRQKQAMDFIGLNYYTRQLVDVEKWSVSSLMMDACKKNHHPLKKNSLGWDIYPEGLYEMLLKLKKYNLPVIITENGISTPDDKLRWEYIHSHLEGVHRAMEKGVQAIGYLYWSLLDNFEWDKGFGPRFGLVEVDYKTQKRTIRESSRKLARVYETGVLE